jgi:tetratricopeptide (TPR) repeat protein
MAELELTKGSVRPAIERVKMVWSLTPEFLLESAQWAASLRLPLDSARQIVAELTSAPPGPAREFLLCVLFRMAGDDDQAAKAELSLESFVKSAASFARKGASLLRAACGNHQERLCAEFLAAQKQPRPFDLLRLGRALYILRQDDAASDAFAAALTRTRTSPEAMYWLGRSYMRLADDCFNRLAASYPDSWRSHELKAEAFHLRQADKDAILEYQAAERLNPNDPKIHEALGEILLDEN